MPSKFDLLREGQAVEFEPGVSGRLNKDTKKLELSTGEILDATNDPDFFPMNDKSLNLSRQREFVEKKAKGPVGEFIHQYSSTGIPGGIGDMRSFLTQTGEEYATRKQAEQQVSERISQESPYISGAATLANIGTDIALTRGMSATKAAPLLTLGSAGSRIITEPQEVALETAGSALLGKGLDKTGAYLSNVAKRRAEIRSLPGQQEAVRGQNIAGRQAVNEANAQQAQSFNILKQNVKKTNEATLKQYHSDLQTRQNEMIKSQNAYEQAKAARDLEVIRLKNEAEIAKAQRSATASQREAEYKAAKISADQETKRLSEEFKLAQSQYQEYLKKLPDLQKKAQAEYSANVLKKASEIEKNFPKSSVFSTDELLLNEFIDEGINKTGIGGSREAGQASRILKSIFPDSELMGGRELSKRYKALEDAIQRSSPEVQGVLNQFKEHLGTRLPMILEDSIAYNKILPMLRRNVQGDIASVIGEMNLGKEGELITKLGESNFKTILNHELVPANFTQKLQNGELSRELANKILTVDDFLMEITPHNKKFMQKQGTLPILMQDAERKHAYFVQEFGQKMQNKLAKHEIKATESARNASQKLSGEIKQTYGMAEPVTPAAAPEARGPIPSPQAPGELPQIPPVQLPPPAIPPQTPPLPSKPNLMAMPTNPTPQSFNPMAEPVLSPGQGFAERSGDFLEKNLLGGNELGNNPMAKALGSIGKLSGLKYLFGKAALPVEGAYLGMKGLTSPTAGGAAARLSFKQGGIQAIQTWAQKYPSYHDGILESPQDRRSLTKEIEDDSEIPIEQKAVIQSKVNRGKPLQDRL